MWPVVERETSRSRARSVLHARVSDHAEPSAASDIACGRIAFRLTERRRRSDCTFALDGWPIRPYRRFAPASRPTTHGSGRCGSLLLHRSGLAPPTPCVSRHLSRYATRRKPRSRPPRSELRRAAHVKKKFAGNPVSAVVGMSVSMLGSRAAKCAALSAYNYFDRVDLIGGRANRVFVVPVMF